MAQIVYDPGSTSDLYDALEYLPAGTTEVVLTKPYTLLKANHDCDLGPSGLDLPDLIITFQGEGRIDYQGGNPPLATITGGGNNLIRAEDKQIFSINLSVTGGWTNTYAYASWFGALGNSTANERQLILKAIDFAWVCGAREVYLSEGTHHINREIILRNRVKLIGANREKTILKLTKPDGNSQVAIIAQGTFDTSTNWDLVQDASPGDTTVTLSGDATDLKKNDYLLLRSNEYYDPNFNQIPRAEMVQLAEDGTVNNVLTFRAGILNDYHTTNPNVTWVEKFEMLYDVGVENLTIVADTTKHFQGSDLPLTNYSNAIEFKNVVNGLIRNVTILDFNTAGISLLNCTHSTVENNVVIDAFRNGLGYAISINNTSNYVTVRNNTMKTARHCINFGSGGGSNFYGSPSFVDILDNYAEGDHTGSGIVLDTHAHCRHINFVGNTVRYGNVGFSARGEHLLFANNEISGTNSYAISVNTAGKHITMTNNVITKCHAGVNVTFQNPFIFSDNFIDQTEFYNSPAIFLTSGSYSTTATYLRGDKIISGNTILTRKSGISSNGLLIQNLIISNNYIQRFEDSSIGGNHYGIALNKKAADPLDSAPDNNLIISNNKILNFKAGIFVGEGAHGWEITGNTITSDIYGVLSEPNSYDIKVQDNIIAATRAVWALNTEPGVSNWLISGNEIKGNGSDDNIGIYGIIRDSTIANNSVQLTNVISPNNANYFIYWENTTGSKSTRNRIINNIVSQIGNSGGQVGVFYNGANYQDNAYVENTFHNFATTEIFVPNLSSHANDRIQRNLGFITENRGATIIAGGTQSVTVSHGLDYTPEPEDITITPAGSLNGNPYYVAAIGSSSFDIQLVAPLPPTDSVRFVWQVNR